MKKIIFSLTVLGLVLFCDEIAAMNFLRNKMVSFVRTVPVVKSRLWLGGTNLPCQSQSVQPTSFNENKELDLIDDSQVLECSIDELNDYKAIYFRCNDLYQEPVSDEKRYQDEEDDEEYKFSDGNGEEIFLLPVIFSATCLGLPVDDRSSEESEFLAAEVERLLTKVNSGGRDFERERKLKKFLSEHPEAYDIAFRFALENIDAMDWGQILVLLGQDPSELGVKFLKKVLEVKKFNDILFKDFLEGGFYPYEVKRLLKRVEVYYKYSQNLLAKTIKREKTEKFYVSPPEPGAMIGWDVPLGMCG